MQQDFTYPYQACIKLLSQRLRAINDGKLREYGLTAQQAILLGTVHRYLQSGRQPSRSDLQKAIHLSGPSVTSLLGSLVKKQFLLRQSDEADGRAFRLSLTLRGSQLIDEMDAVFAASQQKLLAGMSAGEQAVFLDLLNRASHNLSST